MTNLNLNPKWNVESFCGYKPITTYWSDFRIADIWGIKAIKDTYKKAKKEHSNDIKVLTEIAMIMNHSIWFWHSNKKMDYAKVYDELWRDIDSYILEKFSGDDLHYYLQTTD